MGIVSDKKFLTDEEKGTLKEIQQKTQILILELGEIEMIKIQLEERYQNVKRSLFETSNQEKEFTQSLFDKYGKINLNPETGEFTKLG